MAAPKLVTTIIAWDVEPFIPSAVGASEAHDVSIDPSEGEGESEKSSGEAHSLLVILTVFQLELGAASLSGNQYLKRIYHCRLESGRFFE